MRVLVLTAKERTPDLSSFYSALARGVSADIHFLDKKYQRRLRGYLRGIDTSSYSRVLLDVPFKNIAAQHSFLRGLSGLLIYEEDACQNYLSTSKWRGEFSRFYRKLPNARIVVTGFSVAQKLKAEGFSVRFLPKGYDNNILYNKNIVRDIELGFVGRTSSKDYSERKALLENLSLYEPLQMLRAAPGSEYRDLLNRIRFFISADVGFDEYMAKNFEAMACGCVLLAWRQNSEEAAIGLKEGQHLLLYSSLDELRGILEMLRSNSELADKIAAQGQMFVSNNLNHEELAERFIEILKESWPEKNRASCFCRLKVMINKVLSLWMR